mgnify:CR=1 FL=1
MSTADEVNGALIVLYDMVLQRPLESFKSEALDLVSLTLPFDAAIWASGAHRTNRIFSIATKSVGAHVLMEYALLWQRKDTLRAAVVAEPGRALRNEDIMDEREHRASAIYRGFCSRHGMDWTLGCAAADPVTTVGELVFLFRTRDRGPFTEVERDRMTFVAPHLFAAWRQRQSLGLWDRHGPAPKPQPLRCYAVVDDRGLVQAADADFGVAVQRAVPGWLGPVLPDELRRLAARDCSSLQIGSQRFVARHGDRRHLLLALGAEVEPLSSAERRTARAFAAGATHAEIAASLDLSPATVRNQIAAAYRKLGVHNKVELATALTGDLGD